VDTFGNRIKQRTAELHLSGSALAKQIGISRLQMYNWMNGRNAPRRDNLLKLAAVLQVTPEWIMSGNGDPPLLTSSEVNGLNRLFDSYQHLPPQKRKDLRELIDVWERVQA
jgi:transcriptional regulator with XRE-family HTH domain